MTIHDVSNEVNPANVTAAVNEPDHLHKVANNLYGNNSFAPCLDKERLPKAFEDAPNGHLGTHQMLVDDFCRAVVTGKLPPLNAWFSARVNIPGLVAHESALKGGVQLPVTDLGDPPADWEKLTYEPLERME